MNVNQTNDHIKSTIRTATKKVCSKIRRQKKSKFSDNSIDMMQRRRIIEKGTEEHTVLNKNMKKTIRMRTYKTKQIQEAMEENSNMKVLRSELARGRTRLTKLILYYYN
ncbi:hypothetical protein HHI36_005361 [Cryptolaemus montrouzieri]|uniref:Uncharacterized protein n=1 Tax=Cryptolaemus montrouzieri TaxID=559131 RepID=A0ABD2NTX0_9CUCU